MPKAISSRVTKTITNLTLNIKWIEKQRQEIKRAFTRANNPGGTHGRNCSKNLKWQPKTNAQYILNVDGIFKHSDNLAGGGGVLRDRNGNWIAGCAQRFRATTALEAEWKALTMGVQWAKSKGYRDCEIQTDFERIANSISNNSWTRNGQDHAFDFLRKKIMEQGVDRVVHVYRE
ncbi:uncharacterized protein LOC116026359 [Ipomoea triloba]|uniref:uncharacterized protein LOC116026359 n=1 Tax=Ipomoea triloba TaxID=35885 RepID=UPI00125E8C56|nr:uncharacterized protein LOC116026359 [Ipomoea triloba]